MARARICYATTVAKSKRRPALRIPEPIDGVLSRAGENRYARSRPPVSAQAWAAAVGLRIAERARPVGLERGILTVRAATSVWASELSLLSETLLERLRAQGIEVTELRFRVGPLENHAPAAEVRRSRKVPPPAPLPSELSSQIDRVADDELREILTQAARANLAWQKNQK